MSDIDDFAPPQEGDIVKETPLLMQRTLNLAGMAMLTAALIMVCIWAASSDQDNGYLGGLNWSDKVQSNLGMFEASININVSL